MRTLIKNIKTLVGAGSEGKLRLQGAEMAQLGTIDDAWLLVDGERISSFGEMRCLDEQQQEPTTWWMPKEVWCCRRGATHTPT